MEARARSCGSCVSMWLCKEGCDYLHYSRSVLIRILMHDFALFMAQCTVGNAKPQTERPRSPQATQRTGNALNTGAERLSRSLRVRRADYCIRFRKKCELGGRTRTDSDTRRTLPHIDLTAREGGKYTQPVYV